MQITSEQELIDYGQSLAQNLKNTSHNQATVIELVGDVGAGKTTLTRGIALGLGIKEPITSPSFTISKVYSIPSGGYLTHYDFYRLNEPGIIADSLAESLSDPNNVIVIEWGESIKDLLPENHTTITINYTDTGREIIS